MSNQDDYDEEEEYSEDEEESYEESYEESDEESEEGSRGRETALRWLPTNALSWHVIHWNPSYVIAVMAVISVVIAIYQYEMVPPVKPLKVTH